MMHAAITGWGKCLPPAVLSNADLATFLDTSDEWIETRTGIRERRVSAWAWASWRTSPRSGAGGTGMEAGQIDLIVFGTTSYEDQAPNQASGLQQRLGAKNAASMDVNTACTSFLYAFSTANALIRTGAVRTALVIGGEVISRFMDWRNRNVAVLFGDGCAAVVLQVTDREEGLLAEKLGCDVDGRDSLVIQGMGCRYADLQRRYGDTQWIFEGQDIFKRAVTGMGQAAIAVLAARGLTADDIDLVVPHQANLRIIEAVARRAGIPMERVFVNVHRYGNMSAGTVPVALVEALEQGRAGRGNAAAAGIRCRAHLVRTPRSVGARVTPIGQSDAELPACESGAGHGAHLMARRETATPGR
jgi:3-oxoacyl-[acyl-carrier-protein] synthase-3